jgi:ABC-type sugar transport system substrate-binding protein
MHATILQDAAAQGRLAVASAVRHLDGAVLPPEIFTALPVITAENVDEHEPAY